ncbi:MAG: (deoxy)nucleoside triphosphate pyrophosphohydrolase [Deltaproteobacteria bacterium]|uniref:8-oxo-dGTP diphosphatase n=1 Tax=Candidatus Zymogenus saltonus TaxID=2844893 RepID=A0A9D8PLQ4_9DELT|nr:(deoxy)nucleoside triphosphate pyrophosphohydrolase [Candidatus Zymogenus saltonus]
MRPEQIVLVSAALIVKEGRVLVGKRRRGKSDPEKWEFPGGKIRPGEDPRDSIVREIEEELGIGLSVGRLFDAVNHAYPDKSVLILFYLAEMAPSGASSEYSSRDHDEILWAGPEELLRLDFLDADRKVALSLAEAMATGGVS